MTVVAFDGQSLAGDRLAAAGGTPLPRTRKVFWLRAPNGKQALVGFSGGSSYTNAYLNWMNGGPAPVSGPDEKWSILLIEHPRLVWYRSDSANRWDLFGATKWAIGSGADYALGAMAAGKTAADAVRIASRLDVGCGLGVDVVRFR